MKDLEPDWEFGWETPTRGALVRWEPHAGALFAEEKTRERWASCPECRAPWSEFCNDACQVVVDPWNPRDNSSLRRYFD